MKHVTVCDGGTDRFRVYCDVARKYVLDDASEDQVHKYFLGIAQTRTHDAVDIMLRDAVEHGTQPPVLSS